MEEKIVYKNFKKKNFKLLFICLSIILLCALIVLGMGSFECASSKIENVFEVQGQIEKVEDAGDGDYNIFIKDGKSYKVYSSVSKVFNIEEAKTAIGEDVTLFVLKTALGNEVVGLNSTAVNFDKEEGVKLVYNDNFEVVMILLGVVLALMALIILCIVLKQHAKKKTEKEKEVDVFQYHTCFQTKSSPAQKTMLKWLSAYLILWGVLLIPVLILGEKDDTSLEFYVFFGIFVAMFVAFSLSAFWIVPLTRKKSIPYFEKIYDLNTMSMLEGEAKEYFYDLNNEIFVRFSKENLLFDKVFFLRAEEEFYRDLYGEEGLQEIQKERELQNQCELQNEIDDELQNDYIKNLPSQISFDYQKLNLYAKAIFRPGGELLSIYILSKLEDEDAHGLKFDLLFRLDNDIFYWIEKYKVNVRGLSFLLQHRKELMTKYCKGKVKYIIFDENGIANIEDIFMEKVV